MAATLKTTVIQEPSSSTVNITLDSSGNVTGGANLIATNMPYGSSSFLRNRIINGNMQIWQRGTSFTSVSNVVQYGADRWYAFINGVVTSGQILQSSSVPTGLFQYSAAFGRPSGTTATNQPWFCQNIESVNIYDLSSQSVTLSFYAKTGANYSGGAMTVRVATGTAADQSSLTFSNGPATGFTGYAAPINTTQSLTSTWTRYSFTGTFGSGVLEAAVCFAYSPSGTAGADDNIYITGVQLEQGSVATPFERPLYSKQLADCQRYYETSYDIGTAPGTTTANGRVVSTFNALNTNSLNIGLYVPFKVTKRAAPSLSLWTQGGVSGNWSWIIGTTVSNHPMTIDAAGMQGVDLNNTDTPGTLTAGSTYMAYGHFAASAEL